MYTLFFHGEDAVADTLSPYVDAAPTEEQTYFLTTQQVDEARHSIFFNRFFNEVIGVGDGTPGGTMAATSDQITWGHKMVFDRLDRMADELRKDRSKRKLAAAVTLYHLIVEASLAQPGQHMIESLPRGDGPPAGLPRRHAQHRARRAAAHRLRRQAALRSLPRGPGGHPGGDRLDHPRGAALDGRRHQAAELGHELPRVLRLHARRHRRGGCAIDRAEAAGDRPADRHDPRLPDGHDGRPARARRQRHGAAASANFIGNERPVRAEAGAIGDPLRARSRGRPIRVASSRERRSSGTSPTPTRGTSCSTTARRARCRAGRQHRT